MLSKVTREDDNLPPRKEAKSSLGYEASITIKQYELRFRCI